MIFLNSIILGLFDYTDRESKTFYNRTLDRINMYFTIIYACEAGLKIIAYGMFKHKTAYLKEYWNIIDFVVAIIG
jgi:Ion transport protein